MKIQLIQYEYAIGVSTLFYKFNTITNIETNMLNKENNNII